MARSMARRPALQRYSAAELAARARRIGVCVFDVDGVMTDGRIYLGAAGEEMKAFHVADGHGLKMLREAGIAVAILSGRRAECVDRRAAELGIEYVVQGAGEKLPAFTELLSKLRMGPREAAYMGDDLPDVPVMRACGLAFTVPEAPIGVRRFAQHIVSTRGGEGAVREACEFLLRLRARVGQPRREA
jgi:3-deoxy-D-manno-octulosonate 8-phosphate phosphatase (KDO 8-P phosphatase)